MFKDETVKITSIVPEQEPLWEKCYDFGDAVWWQEGQIKTTLCIDYEFISPTTLLNITHPQLEQILNNEVREGLKRREERRKFGQRV